MKICVDTSIWIDFFRVPLGKSAIQLKEFILNDLVIMPIFVRLELLNGVAIKRRKALEEILEPIPLIYPELESWQKVSDVSFLAQKKGFKLGVIDMLIAVLANEINAAVWSSDEDFGIMAQLNITKIFQLDS